jgi:putative nucleotidyltransferase with HDIG domain
VKEHNIDGYLVGGYVRDLVLNRPSVDIDVVCVGDGIAFAKLFAEKCKENTHVNVFKSFGTAQVVVDQFDVEFVGARKESYRADSRKPIVEDGTFDDDQRRRDLTINTLAISLKEEGVYTIIDTFGGLQDIENKIIKTPLDPNQTFSDDPLRILRAIRFASQLGFDIDATTWKGILEMKDRLSIISQERITTELNKIILSPKPSVGFYMLDDAGILEMILPEMIALKGVEIIDGIGHKDNFHHTLEVLDNLALTTDDLWLRWAAVLHDIAKPPTKRFHPQQGWTFHGHEVVGVPMTKAIFKRLKLPLDKTLSYVQKLVRLHLRPISLTKQNITDSAIRRLLFDAGDDLDDLMKLCRADITSKNPKKVQTYLNNYDIVTQKLIEVEEKDQIRNWQPPLSGDEIMKLFNLPPSRRVGELKNAIKDAILDGVIPNTYDDALRYCRELAHKSDNA